MQGTWENGKYILASTKDEKIAKLEAELGQYKVLVKELEAENQRLHDGIDEALQIHKFSSMATSHMDLMKETLEQALEVSNER